MDISGLIAPLWRALDGDPHRVDDLEVTRCEAWLGGSLAVDALAAGAASTTLLATAELAEARGADRPRAQVSAEHVAWASAPSDTRCTMGCARGGFALAAAELEERVFAAGGCATALRTPEEWSAHPAGRAAADAPLVDVGPDTGWLRTARGSDSPTLPVRRPACA